ncbi:MAG: ABC transporter ATP-binding protein [Nitrososphaeraceae archaeon]|nr:ABC transporter ATP-binding protein [Nitrososphaeraceae archaeon]MDW3612287.1 ABC transporter ATP-binding protein [Nitrososphaeraceae archaeon]MDW3626319.1 ABC transporter ATP-binding protein [Nitrososphaeraceae archaeon]MDW3630704.1 ABC transporter ATP-binding protein [Nitrososphaeraceae archaeon]HZB64126.1 ABC transporter ATP-binding protein [Nitrososphaeraceae archaeon]
MNNKKKDEKNGNTVVMELKNITKIFESPAGESVVLEDINFKINRGQFISIVGPSGSGKSTLLNIIGVLDKPTSGEVIINGFNILSLNESEIAQMRNNLIGFIFQSFNLINRTSVQKNIEIPAIIMGMNRSLRHYRSQKLLELLGIKDKAEYKPMNLSGGQQQRVAIARALINDPTIILADEPTGNLDTKTGGEVFGLLKMLTKKYKKTIIIVTHNQELALETDKTIFIRDGKIEKEIIN